MKILMPRCTMRRMIVAVAILGLFFGFLAERRARFLRIAAQHGQSTEIYFRYGGFLMPPQIKRESALQYKYERAARYPWLPVEPD
jgi:hypothetical protein